jgi:hypothetical protein
MGQVVSPRPLTAEAWIQSQASPFGSYDEQRSTDTGPSLNTSVFPCYT